MIKYVAYYRVSTERQRFSGLGLESQKSLVGNYIASRGTIIQEFTEIESGTRKKKRVEIHKAIKLAVAEKAILVVAKLDRLARNVEFTSALYNSGVDFICCDYPSANKLTIQILSVIAENEAEMISTRIKDALTAKKKRMNAGNYVNKDGTRMKPIKGFYRLGNPNGFGVHQKKGVAKIKANSKSNVSNLQATSIIVSEREKGRSYQAIADKLNGLHYTTRYGKKYSSMSVLRLFNNQCPVNVEGEIKPL